MADAVSGVFRQPFKQQVAFYRNKLGNLVPTARWDDIARSAHDTAFMVAGAAKADLLADLAAAVDRAVTEGKSLDAFRKDFSKIVEQRGWTGWTGEGTAKGEAWRTRVIYQTNASTSYAAGRLAQLREGEFDFWVYKHSGAENPRHEHLAWDGLVLRADHPFWQTHFPPNGFGCGCRVAGTRSKKGAERLGGDPEKVPPDGWDTIDPKTGAPVGVGKGWDYQPGDSVSQRVQQMAEKTRQWEYELAKGFMQDLPEGVRDQLARSYRNLPSVADDTRRYAQRVLAATSADVPPYSTLGLLTTADAATVQSIKKLDVAGYDFAVDGYGIKHAHKHHGNDKTERARGQRGVVQNDYAKLPTIVNNPDTVEDAGVSDIGLPLLRYKKQIGGENYTAVFSVRKGRKMLALMTLYVRP